MYGLPAAFVMLISFVTVFWLAYKYLSLTSPKKIFSILFAVLFVIIFFYVNVRVRDSEIISTCVLWAPMVFIFAVLLVFLISKGKHPQWFVTLLCGKKYSDTTAAFVYALNKKKAIKNTCIISAVIAYSAVSFAMIGGFSGAERDRLITSAEDIFYDSFYGKVLAGDPNFKMLSLDEDCVETDGHGKYMVTLRVQASGTFNGGRLADPREKLIYVFLQKDGAHVDDFDSDSVVMDEENIQSYKEKIGWFFDKESPVTNVQTDNTTHRLVSDGVYTLRGYIGTWHNGTNCLLLTTPFSFDETADGSRTVIEKVFFYPAESRVESYKGFDIPSLASNNSEFVVTGRLANEAGEFYFLGISISAAEAFEEMGGVADNDKAICPYCGGSANYVGGAIVCAECGKIY